MTIAIIDSGIDYNSHNKKIIEIVNYTYEDKYDTFGHGTNTYKLINYSDNINAEFIIIKIFDRNGRAYLQDLLEALLYMKEKDIDIICMSLAINTRVTNIGLINRIKLICDDLNSKGTIIISSYANYSNISSPACFDSVLGVNGSFFYNGNEFWYNKTNNNIVTDATPVCIRGIENKRNFFFGNSKACALATNILFNNKNNLLEIEKKSTRCVWKENDIVLDIKKLVNGKKEKITNQLAIKKNDLKVICHKYLNKYFEPDFYNKNFESNIYFKNRIKNCDEIISFFEKYYCFEADEKNILVKDFTNFENLYCSINRWIKK